MSARALVPALCLLGGTALWLLFGAATVVNYDTLYAVVWGNQLVHGDPVSLSVAGAPTPHPLLTLLGVIASPIAGHGGSGGMAVIAYLGYLATATCAVLTGLVARRSAGAGAAVLATLLLVTREPVLSYGLRAYVDLPYLALLLAALALELGRARRGGPVLMLLATAGLLRPEAWLLSAAYLVYLWRDPKRAGLPPVHLIALAAAGPVLWLAVDLVLTGNPLFSFEGTRAGAERLERPTGLHGLLFVAPLRIGEILREDGLIGLALGLAVALRRPSRERLAVLVAVATAAVAFSLVALGGLPVIVRYVLPFGAAGAVAYAYALTGWRAEESIPFGRLWAGLAAALALFTIVRIPDQAHRLDRLHATLAQQQAATDEARQLVKAATCGPIAVPNRRLVPLVALWTGDRPESVITTQDQGVPATGTYLLPSSGAAANAFILDRRDTTRAIPPPPPGWRMVAKSPRWHAYARCSSR